MEAIMQLLTTSGADINTFVNVGLAYFLWRLTKRFDAHEELCQQQREENIKLTSEMKTKVDMLFAASMKEE